MKMLGDIGAWIWGLPRKLLVGLTRFYQICISPLFGPTCRFRPTCSEYFLQSVTKYGAVRGSWRGVVRIAKCHPWNPGGYDPP